MPIKNHLEIGAIINPYKTKRAGLSRINYINSVRATEVPGKRQLITITYIFVMIKSVN